MQKKFKSNEINKLVKILENDGIIAVPTDTVYGICTRMNSKIARDKLEKIKERMPNKSLPIMCAEINQIKEIAIVDKKIEKIIEKFMPGPITLILKKANNVPKFINEKSNEIGVRMAPTKEMQEIITKLGSPVFMTSANKSGEPVCKNIEEIEEKLPEIDAILEGKTSFGQASTIVNCVDTENIFIQREGPITEDEIMKVLEIVN